MTDLNRKDFLRLVEAGSLALTFGPLVAPRSAAAASGLPFTPVRVPHPLPVYQQFASFLPTGLNGAGTSLAAGSVELSSYTAIDDLVVPPEYERYVIVAWGDQVFYDASGQKTDDYFGYNNDFTAYFPVRGDNAGWLVVNHEYVSYPFHQYAPGTPARPAGYPVGPAGRSFEQVIGNKIGLTLPDTPTLPADKLAIYGEFLYNCGLSVVAIVRNNGKYEPFVDPRNRRIAGLSGLALNSSRPGYPTSWGSLPHQQGNDAYLVGTGPALSVLAGSSDGLGEKIIGTFANCSGGATPWGTALSCEENFQGDSLFFVGVTETVKPDGTQTGYTAGTVGELFGLVGEKYGWVVEVDPYSGNSRTRKHTALGRFRHENCAIRAEAGNPVIVYMGDDRRGGHWWKYVSRGTVVDPRDKKNSYLLEDGTLYVAKFNTDGTGQWIPLTLSTPTDPNDPTVISSVQFAEQVAADRDGLVRLPLRLTTPAVPGGGGVTAVAPADGGFANVNRTNQAVNGLLDFYKNKTVGDFYPTLGAALCDAFAVGNLIGGTPSARPEDCEVDPVTKAVYMSKPDGAPGSDGYPDSRIFVVAKYKAPIDTTQQFGDILKLVEDSANGAGATFTWGRLAQGGEVGTAADANAESQGGDGFGNGDNLVFGPDETLWSCIDQSTDFQNGFSTGIVLPGDLLTERSINHSAVGSSAAGGLIGIYGNNWLFVVPTKGINTGQILPFAIGPARCEMTGPNLYRQHVGRVGAAPGRGLLDPSDGSGNAKPDGSHPEDRRKRPVRSDTHDHQGQPVAEQYPWSGLG